MSTDALRLPGGLFDAAGERHREVELAPLCGRDEELLAGAGSPAELVTRLIANRVSRIGGVSPVTDEVARELSVGDRQYLLLELRRATFGPAVHAVAGCPWPGCSARIDVDFSLDDVPVREPPDPGPVFTVEVAAGDDSQVARFRLPNGADQEAVVPLLAVNEAAALTELLRRCLLSLGSVTSPSAEEVAGMPAGARLDIEAAMAAAAPGPELTMEAACPECGRTFALPFDLQDFFFGELHTTADLLFREVHYLAYHYHWSEAEILDLSRDKRRRYIEVLAEEIERLNDAVG